MTEEEIKVRLQAFIHLDVNQKKVEKGHQLLIEIEKVLPFELLDLWAQFLSSYIFSCIETKTEIKCKDLLSKNYTGNQQKILLDAVVILAVKLKLEKRALDWIDGVAYIHGQEAVLHLTKRDELKSLQKSKIFKQLLGPKAVAERVRRELKEEIKAFKNEDYDNIKDVIFMAKALAAEVPKKEKALLAAAKKHLENVIKAAKKEADVSPEAKEYLKGLI